MKQIVSIAVILILCLNLGCHVLKVSKLDVGNVAQPERDRIVGITTKSGEEVSFDPPGGTVEQGTIRASVKQSPISCI